MGSYLELRGIPQLILLLCAVTTSQEDFISTPTSINTTLGSTATFSCSASRGAIGWIVDGTLLSELKTTDITARISGSTSTLHIPATEQYNNTNVTCYIAVRGIGFLDSDPVLLRVQGKPAGVRSLTSTNLILEQIIYVTWDAPATLDITGVDRDISYCVDVRAIADSNDSTPLTTICSVYTLEFNFTMEYPNTSTGVTYEFQITPKNGAGVGPKSDPVYGFFSGRTSRLDTVVVPSVVSIQPTSVCGQPTSVCVPGTTNQPLQSTGFFVGDGIGSAAALLLLIVIIIIVTCFAVIKAHRKKVNMSEQPYYSTVSAPPKTDAVEMNENVAYGKQPKRPKPSTEPLEKNPSYGITGQNFT